MAYNPIITGFQHDTPPGKINANYSFENHGF